MTEKLDPAARLGVKILLGIGVLFAIGETVRLIVAIVRVASGDVDLTAGVVVRIVLLLGLIVLSVSYMLYGRRRLRAE